MTGYLERLRRLSMSDQRTVVEVMSGGDGPAPSAMFEAPKLDPRTAALLVVAALVAVDGPTTAFDASVSIALSAGATPDDLLDTLVVVGPTVGSALLVSAAPKLAMSLGHDVSADLEALDPGLIES